MPSLKAWGAMSGPQWPLVSKGAELVNHRACPLRQRPSGVASEWGLPKIQQKGMLVMYMEVTNTKFWDQRIVPGWNCGLFLGDQRPRE
eukprot:1148411-Pelagomonas_calceolata.AAC.5